MPYEVRINTMSIGRYPTTEEAMGRVREATKLLPPDCEVELIDTRTGQAAEPAASVQWREELATKIGF
jgi:hypothetical protein